MAIIAFIGNKGGVGKTTLAINIATMLNQTSPTSLLDADPQGSTLHWADMIDSESMPAIFDATGGVAKAVKKHRDQTEHLLIDCPPQLHSEQTQAALKLCDIAVIPVLPSPLDIWATVAVSEAIEAARKKNPDLKALLVINQLEPRTKLSRLVLDAISELDTPVASTTLNRRVVYRSSILEGKSVSQMGRPGEIAANEINQLIAEVLDT
ncbi:ParA family partition ATPase [uncultured Cocleimonas sp.]|uniref:ParA family partition ATPase n=1 Tax=uncultured Cocleimonas sp. TaxID=1051587 RepID=UPI002620AEE2|nr:ParA family partition ATPase [uncultured Cocleimonas sp.]